MKKASNKTYASIKSPVIAAAAQGLYSFLDAEQAIKFLELIRTRHTISKTGNESSSEALMWVRDFEVSDDEKSKGYKGNFGIFKVTAKEGGKFTITLEKVVVELKKHPERTYKKMEHPNWGHPVLRGIKRKKLYKDIHEAEKELLFLQEEFPMVCIPGAGKLYAMVYEKDGNKQGVKKYVLTIKAADEGKFLIDFEENRTQKKPLAKAAKGKVEKPKQEAMGEFTTKVLLKRAQKRKPKK